MASYAASSLTWHPCPSWGRTQAGGEAAFLLRSQQVILLSSRRTVMAMTGHGWGDVKGRVTVEEAERLQAEA
jgi:hypothetical protein